MDLTRPRMVFFDVDETLITVKSMFRFLRFHLRALGRPDEAYRRIENRLRDLAEAGIPRQDTNREFYRAFARHDAAEVAANGVAWFQQESARGTLFHQPVLGELQRYARLGYAVVLVSGSFPPCLDPIAERVGAAQVLCSRPEIVAGRYTGELGTPMIEDAKADGVRRLMAEHGAAPESCAAFGDHRSDLAMLSAVGEPVAVGDDELLADTAERLGWRRLPGVYRTIPTEVASG